MAEARASSLIVLVEQDGQGQRVTEALVLVEYGALAAYATSLLVLVEMEAPRACKPTARYIYGGVDITDYCNAADLTIAPKELPKTHLGSTGQRFTAGVSENSVRLKGDWNPTVDALLGVDARRGTLRTGEIIFDDCSMAVSYQWEERARVTEWKVTSPARGKIEWSATLRHNGLGVRTVTAS